MAERERAVASGATAFVSRTQVMSADEVRRAITRIAHEIVERNHGVAEVVLIALQTGGSPIAERLAAELERIEGSPVPMGTLDVAVYRDDFGLRPVLPEAPTDIPMDLTGKVVVLVDDVLFTGRTVRAALNALADFGRTRAVQLAVMVDRGHRELPIRPDYVGKNLPTRRDELVNVRDDGVDLGGEGMKHLLQIDDLGAEGIQEVMRVADSFAEVNRRAIPKVQALRGKTVVSLFFEDSTRTRLSFETAARRLGADVLTFAAGSSSVKKGESLRDTVQTIDALGADAFVVRHSSSGVPHQLATWTESSVVNAGDGAHEHPTQALLDTYTLRQHLGDLAGRRIAIVGDIRHSRVARSNVAAFSALGAEVTLVAPPTLMPPHIDQWPAEVSHSLDAVLPKADVVYLLRMQRERATEALLPSLREYTAGYGLTAARAAVLGPDALVMHPGPMNRGVEIAADVADAPNAVITEQVANGLSVRMAVLYLLLGSGVDLAA